MPWKPFSGSGPGGEVRVVGGRVAERSERGCRTRLGKHRKGIPCPTYSYLEKRRSGHPSTDYWQDYTSPEYTSRPRRNNSFTSSRCRSLL